MIFLALALALLYLGVIFTDATRFIIPNSINLAILLLYLAMFFINPPEPWWSGLAAFGLIFVIGLGIFALGLMGGGDVKLLAVTLLWTGWTEASFYFLTFMALAGGLLALGVIFIRRMVVPLVVRYSPGRAIPRIFMVKQPIPYGLAIAAGFLIVLFQGRVPGLPI